MSDLVEALRKEIEALRKRVAELEIAERTWKARSQALWEDYENAIDDGYAACQADVVARGREASASMYTKRFIDEVARGGHVGAAVRKDGE